MGNSIDAYSREKVMKFGMIRHYVGEDLCLTPVMDKEHTPLYPRNATIVFFHGDGEDPQKHQELFFSKSNNKARLIPWDKSVHVIMIKNPAITSNEESEVMKQSKWNPNQVPIS